MGVVAGNQRSIGSNDVPGTRDDQRQRAAVQVSTLTRDGKNHGSGIAIDPNHILTCAHVLRGGERTYVAADGVSQWASVESVDRANDAAILRVERPLVEYVPIADEELPSTVAASSYGRTSGRRDGTFKQPFGDSWPPRAYPEIGSYAAVLDVPSRLGDSGGGIVAQYRGPVVTVGVIGATDGRRTFSAPFRAIKRLMSKCRCRERRSEPPAVQPDPDDGAPMPPAELSATAESVPHTENARVQWIPADRRLHFQIPRGKPGRDGGTGTDGKPGKDADTSALRKEVEELRKRLDKLMQPEIIPYEVRPEKR